MIKTGYKMVGKCVAFTVMITLAGVVSSLPTYLIVIMGFALMISPVELLYDIHNLKKYGTDRSNQVGERPIQSEQATGQSGGNAALPG